MTREEAIAILEEEAEFLYGEDKPHNRTAFDMAIKALSVPKSETTDRIEYGTDGQPYKYSISNDIPEREKGEWIEEKTFGEGFYHCSVCGGVSTAFVAPKIYKFCPFCGADMRGGKE